MININTTEFKFDPTTLLFQIANNFDFNKMHTNDDSYRNSQIEEFRTSVTSKIMDLPYSNQTESTLLAINEMLTIANYGDRRGYIEHELKSINDSDVFNSYKLLYKYILSLDCSLENLHELFTLWKNDKLLNIDVLLSPGIHTFSDIVTSYDTNPAIRDLTNDLSKISAMRKGKGEFLFAMFSQRISKRAKGDLEINGVNVELKTTDGGSARFSDQDVKPQSNYTSLVQKFMDDWNDYLTLANIPESGLSLTWIYKIANFLPRVDVDQFFIDVVEIFKNLIPTEDVLEIVNAIRFGELDRAKQLYARATFNYYKSIKVDDDAVLYLNISKSPAMVVYFESCEDLEDIGLRLHADTCYPITTKDGSECYPQIQLKKGVSKY
jgi:hypothetical protein